MNRLLPASRHSASCFRILVTQWPRSRIALPWEGRENPAAPSAARCFRPNYCKTPNGDRCAIASPDQQCEQTCRETAPDMRCRFRRSRTGAASVPGLANPRSPNACERAQSRCRGRLALLSDHPLTSSPKLSGECDRHRRSVSGRLGYLEDVAAPVPLEDRETPGL